MLNFSTGAAAREVGTVALVVAALGTASVQPQTGRRLPALAADSHRRWRATTPGCGRAMRCVTRLAQLTFAIAAAACAPAVRSPLTPVPRPAAVSTDFARAADAVIADVRANFLDPVRAAAWAASNTGYSAAIRDADSFETETNRRLAELGTSHTEYMGRNNPRAAELRAVFGKGVPRPSLGVELVAVDGGWYAAAVFAGGPSAAAGLRRGDRIVALDGEPYRPAVLGRLSTSPVTLTIVRHPEAPVQALTITPRTVNPADEWLAAQRAAATVWHEHGVAVGYAKLWSCAGGAAADTLLDGILETYDHADALVVDLRDGWGGCDPSLVARFDRNVPALTNRNRNGVAVTYRPAWTGPLVVLVNRRSRSGKEVVARALQRHRRAIIVGERTAGAVVAGRALFRDDGSVLYIAIADVLVDGERLEGVGVTPDVLVADDLTRGSDRDVALERAIATAVTTVQSGR